MEKRRSSNPAKAFWHSSQKYVFPVVNFWLLIRWAGDRMTSQNRFNSPRKPVDFLFSPVEDQIQLHAQVLFNSGNEMASKVGMNSIIQIKGKKRKKKSCPCHIPVSLLGQGVI
jgi:hypothetical protein